MEKEYFLAGASSIDFSMDDLTNRERGGSLKEDVVLSWRAVVESIGLPLG